MLPWHMHALRLYVAVCAHLTFDNTKQTRLWVRQVADLA